MVVPAVALGSSALLPLDPPYESLHNPLAIAALTEPLKVLNVVAWTVTGLVVPVAAASLIVRFRRARGVERLQLRWLVLAAGLAAALVVALAALAPTGNEIAPRLGDGRMRRLAAIGHRGRDLALPPV